MRLIMEMLFNFNSQLTGNCMKTTKIILFYKHCTMSLIFRIFRLLKENLINVIFK